VRELSGKIFSIKEAEFSVLLFDKWKASWPLLLALLRGKVLQGKVFQPLVESHQRNCVNICSSHAGGLCPGQSALTQREELKMFGQSSGPLGQRVTSIELKNGTISPMADGKLSACNGSEVEVWYESLLHSWSLLLAGVLGMLWASQKRWLLNKVVLSDVDLNEVRRMAPRY